MKQSCTIQMKIGRQSINYIRVQYMLAGLQACQSPSVPIGLPKCQTAFLSLYAASKIASVPCLHAYLPACAVWQCLPVSLSNGLFICLFDNSSTPCLLSACFFQHFCLLVCQLESASINTYGSFLHALHIWSVACKLTGLPYICFCVYLSIL